MPSTPRFEADLAAGKKPFCVVPTLGTTSSSSLDPLPEIAAIARRYDLWLHVDAAYAGPAAVLDEYRHILEGAELADSLVVNPHKWLFTPVDLSALYTRAAGSVPPRALARRDARVSCKRRRRAAPSIFPITAWLWDAASAL